MDSLNWLSCLIRIMDGTRGLWSFVLTCVLLSVMAPRMVSCGRVLVLHPMSAPSHILALRALAKHLVRRGHEVKVVRWLEESQLPDVNYTGITEHVLAVNNSDGSIPMYTHHEKAMFQLPINKMWSHGTKMSSLPLQGFFAVIGFCNSLLTNQQLIDQLKMEKYDLAIVDLLYNECSLALAHQLGLPTVGYWAFSLAGGEAQYTTAVNPPSAVPLMMSHYTDSMSFFQRLHNTLIAFGSHIIMQLQFLATGYEIRKFFPLCPWPDQLLANLSGVLINSHSAVDYPRLLPPSFYDVGGLQIYSTPNPLPKDLDDFLNSSGDAGVILFSLGTSFDFNFVPSSVVENFMGAFRRLDQKVLVKAVGSVKDIPMNVKIVTWIPQQDVLGHPKIRAFLTHCGMHGVLEALYHGVPLIGVPVFGDQEDVMVRLEGKGVVVRLTKQSSQDEIYDAIVKVLNNTRYLENAQKISRLMRSGHDRPVDRAISLLELVMETKGADHLKLASRNMSIFQYLGLDVLLLILTLLLAMFASLKTIKLKYLGETVINNKPTLSNGKCKIH